MSNIDYIKKLVQKVSENSIDEKEWNILLQWLDEESSTQQMPLICESLGINEEELYTQVDKERQAKQWQGILAAISEKDEEARVVDLNSNKRRLWRKWSVAASLILIVSFSSIWYFKHQPQPNIAATNISQHKDSIVPGSTKALLITKSGQRIELDSNVNQVVVQGNGFSITNKQGQLINSNANGNTQEPEINTVVTPKGGQYAIVLSDGTKVKLNAGSSITYPSVFTKNQRNVTITGEAYFEVAKDAQKPFIVATDKGMKVEVLGTHFNINSYTDEPTIKTTLLEGSVKVTAGNEMQMLKPLQQSQLNENGSIRLVNNVDVRNVVAWTEGIFQFKDTDIKTVMREIARWYNVDVNYNGDIPTDLFSAVINRQNNIDQVLAMLQNTMRVHFVVKNRTIYVSD